MPLVIRVARLALGRVGDLPMDPAACLHLDGGIFVATHAQSSQCGLKRLVTGATRLLEVSMRAESLQHHPFLLHPGQGSRAESQPAVYSKPEAQNPYEQHRQHGACAQYYCIMAIYHTNSRKYIPELPALDEL